jgi:hypothetical protein
MFRNTIIASVGAAALAASAMATSASARPFGHWHHHWHGARWVAPALIGLAAAPLIVGAAPYAYGDDCFIRHEPVLTPWGWRWRRVEVCD